MFQLSTVNKLITPVLTGNKRWEWAPILLARVSLGLFFAVSGGNKLLVAEKHADLVKVMIEAGIPLPELMSYFLASVEFFGGMMLVMGLLSTFCSIALTIAMIVAIATVEIHTIPKGLSALDWLSWFLYLPQVLYVLIFIWLMIAGPGRHSVDHFLAHSLGAAKEQAALNIQPNSSA